MLVMMARMLIEFQAKGLSRSRLESLSIFYDSSPREVRCLVDAFFYELTQKSLKRHIESLSEPPKKEGVEL